MQRRRVLAAALIAVSCASSEPPGTRAPAPPEKRKVAILMHGFFNSEDQSRFDPRPIRYAYVDLEAVHRTISDEAYSQPWRSPVRVLSWEETTSLLEASDSRVVRSRLGAALEAMDRAAQEGGVPPVDDLLELEAPVLLPDGWAASDRVLTVVGLETVYRRDPRGVVLVLVWFWFSGDESYLGFLPAAYDFATNDTDRFAALAADRCFRFSE